MNFFETLNFLFYKKREKQPDVDIETASAFSSYMTNRWWSFYDKDSALFTNNVLNRLSSVFDDRSEQFKLYYNLITPRKFKRINYFKKRKEDKDTEDQEKKAMFARNNMLSVREVNIYVDLLESLDK
jgi:hypothetical protein